MPSGFSACEDAGRRHLGSILSTSSGRSCCREVLLFSPLSCLYWRVVMPDHALPFVGEDCVLLAFSHAALLPLVG